MKTYNYKEHLRAHDIIFILKKITKFSQNLRSPKSKLFLTHRYYTYNLATKSQFPRKPFSGHGMAFFSPLLKTPIISLFIISTLLFFLLKSPNYPSPSSSIPHRSLITTSTTYCSSPTTTTTTTTLNNALINYSYIHKCIFNDNITLSLLTFSLFILFFFYILIKTAQSYFSVITTKLSSLLNLTPSIGAITLLALGNGAPDVFSSVAAVRNGNYRTGFGAILSAGTFVSAVVVGFVAIYAAPFWLDPAPFVRDVLFYMIAALFLFWVYLSGEMFLWQAVGFVGFYLFFVGVVFWMDLGMNGGRGRSGKGDDIGLVEKNEVDIGGGIGKAEKETKSFGISRAFEKVCFGNMLFV